MPLRVDDLTLRARVAETLNQHKYRPMEEAAQIVSLFAATSGALGALPVDKIRRFEEGIMDYVRLKDGSALGQLSSGIPMDEETRNRLKGIIEEYTRTIR